MYMFLMAVTEHRELCSPGLLDPGEHQDHLPLQHRSNATQHLGPGVLGLVLLLLKVAHSALESL